MNWISIKDRLPEDGERCLVVIKNGIEILTHDGYFNCWDDKDGDDHYCEYDKTPYWMSLPKLPEVTK